MKAYALQIFLIAPRTFVAEIIINVVALSTSFEYIYYVK